MRGCSSRAIAKGRRMPEGTVEAEADFRANSRSVRAAMGRRRRRPNRARRQGGSERAPEREGAWADGDGELGFLRVGGGEPEDGAAGEAGRADDEGDRRDVAGADRFFAQADAFLRGALGAVA